MLLIVDHWECFRNHLLFRRMHIGSWHWIKILPTMLKRKKYLSLNYYFTPICRSVLAL